MHESSLMHQLLRIVEETAAREGGGRVTEVRVAVGPLAGLTIEHLQTHFALATRGTAAEGARLTFAEPPAMDDSDAAHVVVRRVILTVR